MDLFGSPQYVEYKTPDGRFSGMDFAEEWDWEDPPPEFLPDEDRIAKLQEDLLDVTPSGFAEFAVRIRDSEKKELLPFSFGHRGYLRRLYDTAYPRTLFKCGRQVEKCGYELSEITHETGISTPLRDVRVGDRVVGLAGNGAHTEVGTVTWKSEELRKPCVRVRTRQGHETVIALTHPMRTWGAWTEGGELGVKSRLAVARQAGMFTGATGPHDHEVVLLAYMIAEGYTPDAPHCSFTQNEDGPVLWEFLDIVHDWLEDEYVPHERKRALWQLRFGKESRLQGLVEKWGLRGHLSPTKSVPALVFGLDVYQTSLFLNRLWASDGHCSIDGASYHLEYDTVSERLARDVQRLLWKFGIPTSFRRWKPKLYEGTDKWAYKLRIETQEGARRFIEHIGALGKTEDLPLLDNDENNNRDTYPLEIAEDIKAIHRSRKGYARRGRFVPQPSLRSAGLREKPKYPLSRDKLREYIDFFRSDLEFDQSLTNQLAAHLDTDLFWDEIVEIEDVGEQPCYDITVEGTDSFIADGFITHNSTTLGNKLLCYSCINVAFNSLYVSPSSTQTKTFSNDRLKEPIVVSEHMGAWTNSKLIDNVFLKKFINRSQITLRYAFLNADRVRGIPADLVAIDEIQDVIVDNIPVIEECASHSPYKIFLYSGTPKSLDNTLEYYWANYSTQNEWVVPCKKHGTPNNPASWHWNVLDEDNIGPHGLMCDRCHSLIQPDDPDARWASLNPRPKVDEPYEGYRIPQLMVPWIEWDEILQKQRTYSRGKFYNEVLGLSYDSGTRPLTQMDVVKNCHDDVDMSTGGLEKARRALGVSNPIFMGIDWGTGEQTYTVMVLGAYISGRFTIFYVHRFEGKETDPRIQISTIKMMAKEWGVHRIGVDYGGGFWPNDTLTRTFGMDRVVKYQYSNPSKAKVVWEEGLKRFLVHRTEVMSDIFAAIKRGNVLRFPKWDQFKDPYAYDLLNIFSEYNERRMMDEYKKTPGTTDDTFHAIVTCFLASMIDHPRADVILPLKGVS